MRLKFRHPEESNVKDGSRTRSIRKIDWGKKQSAGGEINSSSIEKVVRSLNLRKENQYNIVTKLMCHTHAEQV